MDVGATTAGAVNVSSLTASVSAAKSTSALFAADTNSGTAAAATSSTEAFSLEISAKGVSVNTDKEASHGEAVKGLTNDQINALKDGIDKSYQIMIKALSEQNAKMQGWLDSGIGKLNFEGVEVEAYKFGLPEVATTPEEAEKAVSEGGAYSVDAVADRLFGMADAISGGDVDKLDKMWSAIQDGFKAATSFWKETTGEDKMPEITQKTFDAIKQRIEDRKAEIGMASAATAAFLGQAGNAAVAANAGTANTNAASNAQNTDTATAVNTQPATDDTATAAAVSEVAATL
jgi:hypothetical protein